MKKKKRALRHGEFLRARLPTNTPYYNPRIRVHNSIHVYGNGGVTLNNTKSFDGRADC